MGPGSLFFRAEILPVKPVSVNYRCQALIRLAPAVTGQRFFPFCTPFGTEVPGTFSPRLLASGPGGIRTPDLFSAIEARSQLRYRPLLSERNCIEVIGDCQVP
jgi:hypothetical protein